MKTVLVGSIVLCHLISPKITPEQDASKIVKFLGEVKSIRPFMEYKENTRTREAIEQEVNMLVVDGYYVEDGKQVSGRFDIKPTACMMVRKETEQERSDRLNNKTRKIVKIEEFNGEEKIVEEIKEEQVKENIQAPVPNKDEDVGPDKLKEKGVLDYIF